MAGSRLQSHGDAINMENSLEPSTTLVRFYQKQKLAETAIKKVVLKNFAVFTGKHLCWSLFFIIMQAFKKRLQHMCFPVNTVKF